VKRLEEIRQERGASDYMSDIEWHFIGHLQTNKLKMVLPYVTLVQSVDSERLLEAINSWGAANSKVIDVLLEPHVAAEETKQGFDPENIASVLRDASEGKYGFIRFKGIMGMATFTDDESVIREDFRRLRVVLDNVRHEFPKIAEDFSEFSIGMSDDYRTAIEYGSTMIRIGSMIFGERSY
jgi:pyridoxal phosphate enzyme (YggS family)